MSPAYIDPVRLRSFSDHLKRYSEVTARSMSVLHMEIERLGSSWRDREYGRFVQEIQKVEARLAGLRAEISRIAPSIDARAAEADEIHREKPGG
ncbi:MAG TPA: hypothetical protein VK804_18420 [Bradyrhizobium sp.]|jgi:hypothetical protein|uniref:hypothetical protein n=1 Tax=Bradyrhizobium sp. TaxID=376 RepID=UPI002C6E674E|nr:hypothetical protein [Bradyrhizobium sp.]HTB02445.1 hypothetical protein [Bradyrhizobium sp.]